MRLHYFFTFILFSSLLVALNSCCYAGKDKEEVNNKSEPPKKPLTRKPSKFSMPTLRKFKENRKQHEAPCNSLVDSRRRTLPVRMPPKDDNLGKDLKRKSMIAQRKKPSWYSKECEGRLMSYKGKTVDQVLKMQLESQDWYTRNSARCYKAYTLQQSAAPEAKVYIKMADKEGFPAATFELVKMALKKGKVEKASEFLELTCKYTADCQENYDDQAHSSLISSIKAYVRKNPKLESAFERFKSDSLFQGKEKEEFVLNEKLIRLYAESPEDLTKGLDVNPESLTFTLSFKHKSENQEEDSDSDPFAGFSDDESKE